MKRAEQTYISETTLERLIGYEGPRWCCYFWFVGWDCLSFGLHICTKGNLEIHLPFVFLRMGRSLNRSHAGFNIPKALPRNDR